MKQHKESKKRCSCEFLIFNCVKDDLTEIFKNMKILEKEYNFL